jgi:RNA polymerase sigma-70 factor (ECF subfamily)
MDTTSSSLLDRLRTARPDAAEWGRLRDLYLPLIRAWLARVPGLRDEADDLAQEALVVVFRELPSFERRRDGSFRAWLRRVVVNRVRAHWRNRRRLPDGSDGVLAELEDPSGDLVRRWDRDHDRHVLRRLLALVEADFAPTTWAAFVRFALEGRPAAAVAAELGTSEGAVLQAKFRVLKRLREEAAGLTED